MKLMDSAKHVQNSTTDSLPYVSVIIPVRCELNGLSLLLPEIMKQDYPKTHWELIIADGESTDGTIQFVQDFARTAEVPITIVHNPGIRSSAGRNAGISASNGEFIIFIDGHCRVRNRKLLSDTVTLFRDTAAECLCRPQPLKGAQGYSMSNIIAEARRSTFGHGRGSMIYNLEFSGFTDPRSSGASYRRSIFTKIGLYDETFDACEDVELNTRVKDAGMLAYTDPRLAVEYDARKSLSALAKQMIRYGRGRIRLALKHPGERSLSSMLPLVVCISSIVPLFGWHNKTLFLVMSLPIALYIFATASATIQLIVRTRQAQMIKAIAVYPAIHFGLGIGMILESAHALSRCLPLRRLRQRRLA